MPSGVCLRFKAAAMFRLDLDPRPVPPAFRLPRALGRPKSVHGKELQQKGAVGPMILIVAADDRQIG